MGEKKKAHVVVLSSPFVGHSGPLLQVLYLLEARHPGLTVTYVADKVQVDVLTDMQSRGELRNLDLRTETVFGDAVLFFQDTRLAVTGRALAEMHYDDSDAWRKNLLAEKDAPGQPTAMISDLVNYWSKDFADELGIPWYVYVPIAPLALLNVFYVPKLKELKLIRDPSNPLAASQSVVIENFPGFPYIRVRDQYPEFYSDEEYVAGMVQHMKESAAVLINTADELDRPAGTVEVLRRLMPSTRVFTVGPSVQMPGFGAVHSRTESPCSSLTWLDRQPEGSVLFVALGTVTVVSDEKIAELARGIEASGVRFLWAIRVDRPEKLLEVLPPGFMERTKDIGLVETKFVPQPKILAHRSTGGFFSHGGWNGTLESIIAGQPMIVWGLSGDHMHISRYVHHVLKIGLAICYAKGEDHDSFHDIDAKDVEKSIRHLMSNTQDAHQLRTNVLGFQKAVTVAKAKGGSSYENIQEVVDKIVNA